MTGHFLPLAPKAPKNGGGRRAGASASAGGLADAGGSGPRSAPQRVVGGDGQRSDKPPPRAAAAAATASDAGWQTGGKGKGGGKGEPAGGKGRRDDAKGGDKGRAQPPASGGHGCWLCDWVGRKGPATPQSLSTHVAHKHGDAPHAPGDDRRAWRAKLDWGVAEVARHTGLSPGDPGWHIGLHQGAGKRGRGGAARRR